MTERGQPDGAGWGLKIATGLAGFVWVYFAERLLDGDAVPGVGQLIVWGGVAIAVLWLLPPTRSLVERGIGLADRALHALTAGKTAEERLEEQRTVAASRIVPESGLPRAGYHLANALTATRLLLAPVVFLAGASGDWTTMYLLFLLANVTDVLDGLVARATNGESAVGKAFDASVDMLLNFGMLLGMVAGMVRTREHTLLPLLLAAFAAFLLYRRLFTNGGGFGAKVASGAWRVVLAGVALLLLLGLPHADLRLRVEASFSVGALAMLGLGLFLLSGIYELWVMRSETRARGGTSDA